jgi:hypothetical protein
MLLVTTEDCSQEIPSRKDYIAQFLNYPFSSGLNIDFFCVCCLIPENKMYTLKLIFK